MKAKAKQQNSTSCESGVCEQSPCGTHSALRTGRKRWGAQYVCTACPLSEGGQARRACAFATIATACSNTGAERFCDLAVCEGVDSHMQDFTVGLLVRNSSADLAQDASGKS